MAQPNVLHIIDTLGIGGAEKVMLGAVNGLPEFQHHVAYLGGSDSLAAHLHSGCRILKLNYRSKFDLLRCALKLRRYIRDNNIEVVHSHLYMASLVARLACPKKVKLVTTIHNLPSKSYLADNRIAKWVEKFTYRKRHHLIAICNEVLKDYNDCIGVKGPYTVLYNYVEDIYQAPAYRKMNFTDTFRMVAVGNLKKQKNYSYLVEAFKRMPKNVYLDIFGAGTLHGELQSEIDKHHLNVRLCGVREDIHNVLRDYDAFIMSSVFEGQPISLLEAMACGMPAILSDIPVLREATNGKAIFYSLEDVNDLIQKVTAILDKKIDLDEFARASFERAKRIASKEIYMTMLRKVYLAHEDYLSRTYKVPPIKILLPYLPANA